MIIEAPDWTSASLPATNETVAAFEALAKALRKAGAECQVQRQTYASGGRLWEHVILYVNHPQPGQSARPPAVVRA